MTLYAYVTPDSSTDCKVPGYFSANPRYIFKPGDIIQSACSDGYFLFEIQADGSSVQVARQLVRDTVLLTTESALAVQEPTGLDAPMVVDFGGPVGDDTDPIQLLADQHFRANIDLPDLRWRARLQIGRQDINLQAQLFVRVLIEGVQPASSLYIELGTSATSFPVYITAFFGLAAGQELWIEMIRDSSGVDSGGLYTENPTLAGWNDATSTFMQISEATVG